MKLTDNQKAWLEHLANDCARSNQTIEELTEALRSAVQVLKDIQSHSFEDSDWIEVDSIIEHSEQLLRLS